MFDHFPVFHCYLTKVHPTPIPFYSYRGNLSSDLDHNLSGDASGIARTRPPQTQYFLAKLGKATLSITTVEDLSFDADSLLLNLGEGREERKPGQLINISKY